MQAVYVVDDNPLNLRMAMAALKDTYRTVALPSAPLMFKAAEKIVPDLILLDVAMPEMDGFEAIAALRRDDRLKTVPVVFLTASDDTATEVRCFEAGGLDFIKKPYSPLTLRKRIETHLGTDRLVKEARRALRDIHNATISVIADMVESRDKVTGGHIERTQGYLEILIGEMFRSGVYAEELAARDLTLLLPSAELHDVGKIVVSDVILNKPGKLTDEEYATIKRHCEEGVRIIDKILSKTTDDGFLRYAKRFAGYHHEKWDGTGYPNGLAGEDIPLEGRLMAVADVYDALVSERPYKKPLPHEQAVNILQQDAGTHFDPKIAEVFSRVADKFLLKLEGTS
jgi:putative two-component system response regulator